MRNVAGFTLTAAILVALVRTGSPAGATAQQPSWCRANAALVRVGYLLDSDDARVGNPRGIGAYNREERAASSCPTGPARDFVYAYLYSWKAAILHFQRRPWQTQLHTGNVLLRRCIVRNYGSVTASNCQSDLAQNATRQRRWTAATR